MCVGQQSQVAVYTVTPWKNLAHTNGISFTT